MSGETATEPFRTAGEAVAWITSRMNLGIRPGLKRMEALMEKFDHPERRLKFIHVAGTNGKGSTCAFLTHVLRKSGYDVGTFTSPYLGKYNNRIQYNLQPIDDETLLRLVNEIKPVYDEIAASELGPPTMFEVSTTLALLYFAKVTYPDFVVWETGLGGRLDSTNVVVPLVSVITNVGHDHMEILGDSLADVAREKAGIIKPGVPTVTAVEQPEALREIERTAAAKRSTLYVMGRQFGFEPANVGLDSQSIHFYGPFRRLENVPVSLNGAHQMKNAAISLMTIEVLRQYYAAIVEDEDLMAAMGSVTWPGRLELVSDSPRILLDGAHNPEGAETLARALRELYRYERLYMMVGMMRTKDHAGALAHLVPLADALIVTEPVFAKKASAETLAESARSVAERTGARADVIVEPDWKAALERLKRMTGPNDLAVVTGSLYLISDVRSLILQGTDSDKGW